MKSTPIQSLVLALTLFLFLGLAQISTAAEVRLDILFMNHGPMRPTVTKIKTLLEGYGNNVKAEWYDADLKSGKSFMRDQNITGHIPLLIQINGQSKFTIDERPVTLQGFPTGAAPFKRVEGDWSLDDLKYLLDESMR